MDRCKNCAENLEGRQGKKFCDAYCKSAYHYKLGKQKEPTRFAVVDKQLKLNRRLLKKYNRGGAKTTIRQEVLLAEGFDPNFFTNYWKNGKGQVYLFCYEFGFLKLTDNKKVKYLLVQWQDYMGK